MVRAGSGLGGAALRVLLLAAPVLALPASARSAAAPGASQVQAPDAISAADKAAALAATREGNRLLDAGKAEEALERFRQAHRLVGGDKLRYNLGQALRAIPGREVEAFTEFDTFLARVPSAPADLVEEAATERRALGARLGFITIDAPEAALVSVDGQPAGRTPLPQAIVVRPGSHVVHLEKRGFRPVDDGVTVRAGERLPRSFKLTRIQVVMETAGATGVAGGGGGVMGVRSSASIADKPSGLLGRWWFWAAVGAVAAAAVGAVVLASDGGKTKFECPTGVGMCRELP
jgi:hypothetical protein